MKIKRTVSFALAAAALSGCSDGAPAATTPGAPPGEEVGAARSALGLQPNTTPAYQSCLSDYYWSHVAAATCYNPCYAEWLGMDLGAEGYGAPPEWVSCSSISGSCSVEWRHCTIMVFGTCVTWETSTDTWTSPPADVHTSIDATDNTIYGDGETYCCGQNKYQAVVFPTFFLSSILYPPPGISSTPELGSSCATGGPSCSVADSSVSYASSFGSVTTNSLQDNFTSSSSVSSTSDLTIGVAIDSVGFKMSNDYSTTDVASSAGTSLNTETITESVTSTVPMKGGADGVNHLYDEFSIILNPAQTLSTCGYGSPGSTLQVGWNMEWGAPDGSTTTPSATFMQQEQVLACQVLGNCTPAYPLTGDVAHALGLPVGGFAAASIPYPADACALLAQDPFIRHCNASRTGLLGVPSVGAVLAANPARFVPTGISRAYNPPIPTGGGGFTCNILTDMWTLGVSFGHTATSTLSSTLTTSSTFKLAGNAAYSGVSVAGDFGLTSSSTATVSQTPTFTSSSSSTEVINFGIGCSSPGYLFGTGAWIDVYWDTIYNTLVFVPIEANPAEVMYLEMHLALTNAQATQGVAAHLTLSPADPGKGNVEGGTPTELSASTNNDGVALFYSAQVIPPGTQAILTVGDVSVPVVVGGPQAPSVTVELPDVPQPDPVLPPSINIVGQTNDPGQPNDLGQASATAPAASLATAAQAAPVDPNAPADPNALADLGAPADPNAPASPAAPVNNGPPKK